MVGVKNLLCVYIYVLDVREFGWKLMFLWVVKNLFFFVGWLFEFFNSGFIFCFEVESVKNYKRKGVIVELSFR